MVYCVLVSWVSSFKINVMSKSSLGGPCSAQRSRQPSLPSSRRETPKASRMHLFLLGAGGKIGEGVHVWLTKNSHVVCIEVDMGSI